MLEITKTTFTWVGSLFNYRVIVAHQMRVLSPHASEYTILHVVSLYGKVFKVNLIEKLIEKLKLANSTNTTFIN
jgi:hypothetical protein